MDLRRMTRVERGFPCVIRMGRTRHKGTVTNLAPDGLFVQTRISIPPGTQVKVHVPEADELLEMTVRAIVVRQRLLPNRSSELKQDGVGLRILQAPDAYYALVEREMKASEPPAPPDPSLRRFQVRVAERKSTVFRVLTVTTSSPEAARNELEDELGPEWQVMEVLSS